MGSFSIWHWLIVLVVVVLIFGTKKLRNIGSDVGGAVKNFKDAMGEEKGATDAPRLNTITNDTTPDLIEADVVEVKAAPKRKAPTVKKATTPKSVVSKQKAATAKKVVAAKPKATSSTKVK